MMPIVVAQVVANVILDARDILAVAELRSKENVTESRGQFKVQVQMGAWASQPRAGPTAKFEAAAAS